MNLPEDCRFAYVVNHEAWWYSVLKDEKPGIMVMAAHNEGGVAWEFEAGEMVLGGESAVKIHMFNDSFDAFTQVPEFFAALAEEKPGTLDGVRTILDRLGAVDRTARTRTNC